MKRFLLLFFTVLFFLIFSLLPVTAHPPVQVKIDGLGVKFDVLPVIKEGRVLVPFRALSEGLNTKVKWDENTQSITAIQGNNTIILEIGKKTALINDSPLPLDVPPTILDGRTLIPLRFFSEALNCQVNWNAQDYIVDVKSAPKSLNVIGFYALGDRNTSSWTNLFQREYPETSLGNTHLVHELALGWYSLDQEGQLLTKSTTGWQRPVGWENVLAACNRYNLKPDMVIHATNKDRLLIDFLSNETAVNNLVNSILAEVSLYGGVNLNLEGLGLSQQGEELLTIQENFTEFVNKLAHGLKPINKKLTLTLHAPNSVYKGYNYQALGAIADRIIIMAYEYGGTPEPAGKVVEAVEMAKSLVPIDKLILGINIPRETSESLITKVGIAKKYDLNGIALWRLGLLTPQMWSNLETTIIPRF